MQILNQAVITQQGLDLMAEASAGINQISFPKAVTTDDEQYTSMNINQLEALSDIDSVKQAVQPATPLNSYVYVDNDGQQQLSDEGTQKSTTAVTVPIVFPNKDVTEDYMIQAVGLYAHDENKNVDILYSIMTAATPRLQPAYNGTTPTSFKIKAITAIGRTSQLKTEVNDFDTVSEEEFRETLKDYAAITYVDERLKNLKDVVYATKPESPTLDVKANDTSVDYQIMPALWYGRAEIEKFILYYKKHTDTDYSHIDVDIHQLSGNLELQGGNQYDFYATAVNQSYESDGSTVQSYVLGKVPYNVKLTYTVDVQNKTINYTITADSNSDTPVTNYRLMFKDTNDANWKWNDIKESNYKLDGCTLGHTYLLKAIAFNAVGESNVTDMQTVTVGDSLHAPQLSLSFNGSLNYQITPADDSDNPLKLNYYTVYYKRDSDLDWNSFRTTNLSGTIPNIQNGAKYVSKATATNSIGESTASAVTPAVITGTKPYNCQLTVTPNYASQSVSWSATANSDYGLPILSYTLYYRDVTANSDWITTTDRTVTGFISGHSYAFKTVATSTIGVSNYSDGKNLFFIKKPYSPKLSASYNASNLKLTVSIADTGSKANAANSFHISAGGTSRTVDSSRNQVILDVSQMDLSEIQNLVISAYATNAAGSSYTSSINFSIDLGSLVQANITLVYRPAPGGTPTTGFYYKVNFLSKVNLDNVYYTVNQVDSKKHTDVLKYFTDSVHEFSGYVTEITSNDFISSTGQFGGSENYPYALRVFLNGEIIYTAFSNHY